MTPSLRPEQSLRLVETHAPSAPARHAMIRVEDLSIVFDARGGQVIAVDRVSLAVSQGEFVSIVGP